MERPSWLRTSSIDSVVGTVMANVMKVMRRGGDLERRRIATIGMFDGVHLGHRYMIDFLKAEGERRGLAPTVVTFEDHPLALVDPSRRPKLLSSVSCKMALLEQAGITDCVLLRFSDSMRRQSARDFMRRLKERFAVDTLVVGFNHSFGHDRISGLEAYQAVGREVGVEVIAAPEYTGPYFPISSSKIRTMLSEGKLSEANAALGHCFTLAGTVVEGNRLGRKLGYPTANIRPEADSQLIPPDGVYAVRVYTDDGSVHNGMLNIGVRPTVDNSVGDTPNSGRQSIEVHIFDFLEYLYDRRISVEFVEYIRPEKRFASLDKLKARLAADEKRIRQILESGVADSADTGLVY